MSTTHLCWRRRADSGENVAKAAKANPQKLDERPTAVALGINWQFIEIPLILEPGSALTAGAFFHTDYPSTQNWRRELTSLLWLFLIFTLIHILKNPSNFFSLILISFYSVFFCKWLHSTQNAAKLLRLCLLSCQLFFSTSPLSDELSAVISVNKKLNP